ncbi:MAG: hypothetical protein AB1650_09490 [Candidatus Omnitrophota bacterium]
MKKINFNEKGKTKSEKRKVISPIACRFSPPEVLNMFYSFTNTSTIRELRRFGLIFGPTTILISIWQVSKGHWGHVYFFGLPGTYALIMALFKPQWNYPLRWALEKIFKGFMWLVTEVVLIACFYLVFTPIGILIRWMGKDLLDLRIDLTAETYWRERERKEFDTEHYRRQF